MIKAPVYGPPWDTAEKPANGASKAPQISAHGMGRNVVRA